MKLKELLRCVSGQIEIFYLTHTQRVYEGHCLCSAYLEDKMYKKLKQVIKKYGDKEVDLITHREDKMAIDIYDNH